MQNKTFYGKNLQDLNQNELQLLGIDIQLCSLGKKGEKAIQQIALTHKFRVRAVNEVMNCGGQYSRETFLEENGLVEEGPNMIAIKSFTEYMNKATQEITGVIVDALRNLVQDKPMESENDMNGKNELGFQMN